MLTSLSPLTIGLLIFTPGIIAGGQILFKMASTKIETTGAPFHMIILNPIFIGACTLYAAATFLWAYALKTAPLSYAYSFMALSYVLVPVLAYFWLGETVGWRYAIGMTCIILGLLIINS